MSTSKRSVNRRTFLRTSLGAAAVSPLAGMAWKPYTGRGGKSEILRVASIGVGGMGWTDLRQVASHPAVEIAALCDVDSNNLGRAEELFPEADTFRDWRELFSKHGNSFDAVTISTPDHMHAPIAMTALMANKSVYCQKPLTHTIYESRRLREVASRKPILATQMGTQNASRDGKLQALAMLKAGAIGELQAVHGWSDRPAGWWPQGQDRPAGSSPVPDYLDWNGWVGVAPMRPYKADAYAPFKWRGIRDFGCGALGDMACHICDTPIQAFKLYTPTSVLCEATDATADMFPSSERVVFEFKGVKASGGKPVKLVWTDGGRVPSPTELNIRPDYSLKQNTVAVVGSKATLLIQPEAGTPLLFENGDEVVDAKLPDVPQQNHWHQWVDAAFYGNPTQSSFGFAGRMCETLALGALASRFPNQTLAYDAKSMTFPDFPEANKWVRTDFREGWAVDGLSG
ncbi:MAG: Gfo/Idh/MocA family oxidoreductase [Planctomycetota bacterium]|nr:Gfo/Idh/MocA family oxidoreductase [Planctomycetota bacterium]